MIDENTLILKMKKKYKGRTYKEISSFTGLNISRLFRIFNGSKITYKEAQILHRLLDINPLENDPFLNPRNKERVEAKIYRLSRTENISEGGF